MLEIPPTLGALAAAVKGQSRATFLAEFREPFLLRQNEPGLKFDRNSTTTAFNTMALDQARIRARAKEVLAVPIFAVRKRAGANAFGHMITMGRAPNNDIVFADQQVSKFHASLAKNPAGQWALTDASSNGTWVDGRKLEHHAPYALGPNSSIDLAHAVILAFLPPDRVFDELETIWRREAVL